MIDPREGKLPVWAQDLLKKERRLADEAVRKLNEHLDTVEKTSIWYGRYDNPVYIPGRGQRVHFNLNTVGPAGDTHNEVQVGFAKDGGLEIMGGRSITIKPQASNIVVVKLKDLS